jgi:hypothetical protein
MIDLGTVTVTAFGAASLGFAFLHYKIASRMTKNRKAGNSSLA